MKAVMYHYVRPAPENLPHFRYLHVDHFVRQLDFLDDAYGLLRKDEFEESISTGVPKPGVVLTFDDAFIDHHQYVAPILEERRTWGVFYVPTGIYESGQLLDVHRIHQLVGRYGGVRCVEMLSRVADESMFPDAAIEEFRTHTYRTQSNDDATMFFKRMLNFYVAYQHRRRILDELMEEFLDGEQESDLLSRTYMSPDQVREIAAGGNIVGSHSVYHQVMSKLDLDAQQREIEESFNFLARVIDDPIQTFCYPHGGFHTFTRATEEILDDVGALYSFNVEARDIEATDLRSRPQALPRYDCNLFPHGKASMGPALADP